MSRVPKLLPIRSEMSEPALGWSAFYVKVCLASAWFALAVMVASRSVPASTELSIFWIPAFLFCGLAPIFALFFLIAHIKRLDERERGLVFQAHMEGVAWVVVYGCLMWLFSQAPAFQLSRVIGTVHPIPLIALPALGYLFAIILEQIRRRNEWLAAQKDEAV